MGRVYRASFFLFYKKISRIPMCNGMQQELQSGCCNGCRKANVFAPQKMRSAQAPFGTWAIMKKFIYVCNE